MYGICISLFLSLWHMTTRHTAARRDIAIGTRLDSSRTYICIYLLLDPHLFKNKDETIMIYSFTQAVPTSNETWNVFYVSRELF